MFSQQLAMLFAHEAQKALFIDKHASHAVGDERHRMQVAFFAQYQVVNSEHVARLELFNFEVDRAAVVFVVYRVFGAPEAIHLLVVADLMRFVH